ncbi:hypothetical protein QBC34DRAFT_497291 [Podospora aff. communis PSN243]|uniref:Uncharacterized protein n=1 Tax=Podospora aff. communis PSN243 TaxID=3040156 RepID=A0AAV9GFD9_9PEZI|nr:hypothetical protein QBC34DRAFT_497291 [Podospora aff. communis PSN243]
MSIQLSPSNNNLPISPSDDLLSPLPSPVFETATMENQAPADNPPKFKLTPDGKVVDWSVMRRKCIRKGPWYPSDHYVTLVACDLAERASKSIPLEKLYRMVLSEWSDVRVARRPLLDDRKVFFYEMVLEYVEAKADERFSEMLASQEKKEAMDIDREEFMESRNESEEASTYCSQSESDDSPVSEIDWDMIAAAAVVEDRTQDGN